MNYETANRRAGERAKRKRRTFAELCAAIDRADEALASGLRNEDKTMIASARSMRSAARRELKAITEPTLL